MMELQKKLENFSTNETEIDSKFKELANDFLYNGYINVRDRFFFFFRAVEFYYHEEKGPIKDPIVYHRNNKDVDGQVPYYPAMTLHSHSSGFDIAFENKKKEIRSSVLIRAYEVYDVKEHCLWCWEVTNGKGKFVRRELGKVSGRKTYNTQSTYLKTFLNGFPMGGNTDITWVNECRKQEKEITVKPYRQGVFRSELETEYIPTTERDNRKWAFWREEDIVL